MINIVNWQCISRKYPLQLQCFIWNIKESFKYLQPNYNHEAVILLPVVSIISRLTHNVYCTLPLKMYSKDKPIYMNSHFIQAQFSLSYRFHPKYIKKVWTKPETWKIQKNNKLFGILHDAFSDESSLLFCFVITIKSKKAILLYNNLVPFNKQF